MIRERVKERIHDEWLDAGVATWVISQLPLLDLAANQACPILSIPEVKSLNQPSLIKRLIIPGGLEGTTGHVKAFEFARESRALMKKHPLDGLPIYALLEPDSFIKEKGRNPLVTQPERAQLWTESGLADGVILLPDRNQEIDPTPHLLTIHQSIAPTLWLTTGENSAMVEILKRGLPKNGIDVGTIIPKTITPHASFLAETKSMERDDVRTALFEHVALLYRQKHEATLTLLPPRAYFTVIEAITDKLTAGL